jgi:UDP-N-acetylmuramoylalanine--D-glutamate ligase
VDRAFVENRSTHALEICQVDDVQPAAIHNVANALAAIALARSYGVTATAIKEGLLAFRPAPHRVSLVREFENVRYINDSKATNAHAAQTSILSFDNVIWIAGGDAKGQNFDELAQKVAKYLKVVILIGRDQEHIASSLQKFSPDIQIHRIQPLETDSLVAAVKRARDIADPNDVVLLAPACASWDMFENYAHRGRVFEQAVEELS